jgi:heterodisulfide reductase subunit C
MDYTPRALMRLLQAGLFDEALRSRTIWMCTTCYSCTVRCPRDIHVTDILGQLRGIAAAEGYAETAGMTFNKAFLDIVRRYGRMFEPELLIRYHLRQEPLGILGAAPIGLALFQKGKISPLPERLSAEGLAQIRRIFEAVEARQKAAPAASSHA